MNGLYELGIHVTVTYSKLTAIGSYINHSRPKREEDRRLRKSMTPPVNVNDLFLQRAFRRITTSEIIALMFLAYIREGGLLFFFTSNETNFQQTFEE